ncbi:beta-1,6-N-acetylglucosaminyltransferase [Yoonia sp. I 8.24]|uniref:beta-1,6-N-acetylglucosaminyltransferase n=1 Tax=Yoonia sp. I 8.24 TaxID=1537229 RepID=UPI001EDD19EF|nr:beta-1,6-N-acetylglucosaminyltransferase [Yoonia sp. I 8.24]MCG3268495.1 glycosyl transferase [Yoonia sp. I 8.24]
MSLGVVMLVHTDFDRAELMVRHWAEGGCPVMIHVDSDVDDTTYDRFVANLDDLADVRFSTRHRCEWGMWGLVAATQDAVQHLLTDFEQVGRVFLASGSCLPLRPISELRAFLDASPQTDFIESATTADVPWTVGGLDRERFTLRFPFAWKRRRRLFDGYVRLQQIIGIKRRIPKGLMPHMGSQWWCLTRTTLEAILNDPNRRRYDRYFQRVWIPDESYFQTLARKHAARIQSRSLTLSKFDFQGKPHIFYDDHVEILRRSGCFVARKIWPNAQVLYENFPCATDKAAGAVRPSTGTVDRIFDKAVERRTRGRAGLYMHSRFPNMEKANGIAAAPFSVMQGFDALFPGFQNWLALQTEATVHGHLYAKDKAHFADGAEVFRGALSDSARLRDYNAQGFLTNLMWTTRDQYQCFMFGPADTQSIRWLLAHDTNARVWVISGAWSIPLFLSGRSAAEVRTEAARLQRRENQFLKTLRAPDAHARLHIYTLADFLENPRDVLQMLIDQIGGHKAHALGQLPEMVDLSGLPVFLQELKNQGMHPFLTGHLSEEMHRRATVVSEPRSYVVGHK